MNAPLLLAREMRRSGPDQPRTIEPDLSGADFAYDSLLDGLEAGRYGGVPITGAAPRALIEVLRRCRWPVSPRRFAGAVPHFQEQFGLAELRDVLWRLGIQTRAAERLGRYLGSLPKGSFVLGRQGNFCFADRDADGQLGLLDPSTGRFERIKNDRRYRCVVCEEAREAGRNATPRSPTLAGLQQRFRPELRMLLLLTTISSMLVLLASMSVAFIFNTVLPTRRLTPLS